MNYMRAVFKGTNDWMRGGEAASLINTCVETRQPFGEISAIIENDYIRVQLVGHGGHISVALSSIRLPHWAAREETIIGFEQTDDDRTRIILNRDLIKQAMHIGTENSFLSQFGVVEEGYVR